MIDIGPGVVLEALEVAALVYLMWVVGELGAALRERLGATTRTKVPDGVKL